MREELKQRKRGQRVRKKKRIWYIYIEEEKERTYAREREKKKDDFVEKKTKKVTENLDDVGSRKINYNEVYPVFIRS